MPAFLERIRLSYCPTLLHSQILILPILQPILWWLLRRILTHKVFFLAVNLDGELDVS